MILGSKMTHLFHFGHKRKSRTKRKKIKLNFYFHTSLWSLKRFYEGLKTFIKPFEAPQRSMKIKFNLMFISIQLSEMHETGRVKNEIQSTLTIFRACHQAKFQRKLMSIFTKNNNNYYYYFGPKNDLFT